MAEKKPFFVGNVRLSDLNGFEDCNKNGVRGCFIPYDQNPSLYVGANQQTGVMTLDLDILVRETSNSKSGSSHFIKLNVGKSNRERFQMSLEAVDSLKIVGNLFTKTPGQTAQGRSQQGAPAPHAGYQQGGAQAQYPQQQRPYQAAAPSFQQGGFQPQAGQPYQGADMPDFSAPRGQQAGW